MCNYMYLRRFFDTLFIVLISMQMSIDECVKSRAALDEIATNKQKENKQQIHREFNIISNNNKKKTKQHRYFFLFE